MSYNLFLRLFPFALVIIIRRSAENSTFFSRFSKIYFTRLSPLRIFFLMQWYIEFICIHILIILCTLYIVHILTTVTHNRVTTCLLFLFLCYQILGQQKYFNIQLFVVKTKKCIVLFIIIGTTKNKENRKVLCKQTDFWILL